MVTLVGNIPPQKICKVCEEEKPIIEFYKACSNKDGIHNFCKKCCLRRAKDLRDTHNGSEHNILGKEEKYCRKCKKFLPNNAFSKDSGRNDGLHPSCKNCLREYKKNIQYLIEIGIKQRIVPAFKECSSCHIIFPITEFCLDPSKGDGHDYECRDCNVIKSKIRKSKNIVKTREKYKRDRRNRISKKKNLPCKFTEEDRKFMLQYFGYACAVCGREEGFDWKLSEDHWIPIFSVDCPGTVVENMLPLCIGIGGCNNSKSNRNGYDFLVEKFGVSKARKIEKNIREYFKIVSEKFVLQTISL